MDASLDLHELINHKQIVINLSLHYGGDSGTAIRYNPESGLWELVEWDSSLPRVCATDKDPMVLIEKEKKLT
jgi:hypothetical protein